MAATHKREENSGVFMNLLMGILIRISVIQNPQDRAGAK
jgi:hypothetical protein